MAKSKTKTYKITAGHILHNGEEYFTGDTIELTDEQAALLMVEPAGKAPETREPSKELETPLKQQENGGTDLEKTLFGLPQ